MDNLFFSFLFDVTRSNGDVNGVAVLVWSFIAVNVGCFIISRLPDAD